MTFWVDAQLLPLLAKWLSQNYRVEACRCERSGCAMPTTTKYKEPLALIDYWAVDPDYDG